MCPMGGYLFIVLPILYKAFDGSLPVAFFIIEYLVKFNQRISNIVKCTLGKKNSKNSSIALSKNDEILPEKKTLVLSIPSHNLLLKGS
jgi:hypothetical protein